MSDFWDALVKEASFGGAAGSIDKYLQGTEADSSFDTVRALTDSGRAALALPLPVLAGTRVSFTTNIGSLLSYTDAPEPGMQGTVVYVKSAGGDVTHHEGLVFVSWDDGKFRAIHAEHLRGVKAKGHTKTQNARVMRASSLGDLTDFLKVADGTLIHKATKDLWSFRKEGEDFVLEQLFDASGGPIKV